MVDDGYIRLTYEAFCQLRFLPHMAWDDNELRDELLDEGMPVTRAGYCEWTAAARPHDGRPGHMISLGWAWMEAVGQRLLLVPHGIQSNIMLVSDDRADLGTWATQHALSGWLSTQPWAAPVMAAIDGSHGPSPSLSPMGLS
jgi:hypothetical protein